MKLVVLSSQYLGIYIKRGNRIINQKFITDFGDLEKFKLSDEIGKSNQLFLCLVPDMEYISKISFFEKPNEKIKQEAVASKINSNDTILSGISLLRIDKTFQFYINSIKKSSTSKIFEMTLSFLMMSSISKIKISSISQITALNTINNNDLNKALKAAKTNIIQVSILENIFENSYVVSLSVAKTFLFSRYIKKDEMSDKYINQILRTTIEYLNTNLPNFKSEFHVIVYSSRENLSEQCTADLDVKFNHVKLNVSNLQDMYGYFLKDVSQRFFSHNYYPSMFLSNREFINRGYIAYILKLGIVLLFSISLALGLVLLKKAIYDVPRILGVLSRVKDSEKASEVLLKKMNTNLDIGEFEVKSTIVNFNKENNQIVDNFNTLTALINEIFNDIENIKMDKYVINKKDKGYMVTMNILILNPEGYSKSMQEKYNLVKNRLDQRISGIKDKTISVNVPEFVSKKSIKPDFTELSLSIVLNIDPL